MSEEIYKFFLEGRNKLYKIYTKIVLQKPLCLKSINCDKPQLFIVYKDANKNV